MLCLITVCLLISTAACVVPLVAFVVVVVVLLIYVHGKHLGSIISLYIGIFSWSKAFLRLYEPLFLTVLQ